MMLHFLIVFVLVLFDVVVDVDDLDLKMLKRMWIDGQNHCNDILGSDNRVVAVVVSAVDGMKKKKCWL